MTTDKTAEKLKDSVFRSLLKLFVCPNPGPEHLTEILMRDRPTSSSSGKSKKLPFYIVLTPDRVNPRT